MARVKDWRSLSPGIPVVDDPASPDHNGNGMYGLSPMDEAQQVRVDRMRSRSLSAEELEQLEDEDLARLQRTQTRMAIIRALQGDDGRGRRDDTLAPLIQQLVQSNQESQRTVIAAIQQLQRGQQDDALTAVTRGMDALERRLTQLAERLTNAPAAPTADTASALATAVSELRALREFRTTMDEALDIPSQAQQMVSRDQAVQQLRMEFEVAKGRAEMQERLEDRRQARLDAEREYEFKKHRLDGAMNTAQQIAPAVLAAILGDKAKDFVSAMGGGGGAPAAPPANGGGGPPQAQIAPPPNGAGSEPPPGIAMWVCPTCNAQNLAQPTATFASCARCGLEVEPFPSGEEDHEHSPPGLEPPAAGPPAGPGGPGSIA
jgi:hypothetical protein